MTTKTRLDRILEDIRANSLIGIRAGADRKTFLEIWMVVVEGRIFARSWGLSEKSWFQAFELKPDGAIRIDGEVLDVKAVVPDDLMLLNARISQAYLEKYNKGDNSPYALGIIRPEHCARTMEFIPVTGI